MPITLYLDGHKFDPETKRVMGVAFEIGRAAHSRHAMRFRQWRKCASLSPLVA
jgi:hypothetical protein